MDQGQSDRDRAAVRARNLAQCVQELRERGDATLTELAAATGLSRPTVESILGDLQPSGAVAAVDATRAKGVGRPARQFAFVPDAAYVAGIDLGLATARAMLSDLSGRIIAVVEHDLPDGIDAFERLEVAAQLVDRLCRSARIPRAKVRSTAVAVSGIVDDTGRMRQSDLIPEWTGVDLRSRLERSLPGRVVVENDVKVAAIAEHHAGAARLVDDAVFVKIDRYISTAIILGGRLHAGHRNAAGEVGTLDDGAWIRELPSEPLLPSDRRSLIERAAAGDDEAERVLTTYTTHVARSIALVALTIDPEIIVVGGVVSELGEPLLGRLRERLESMAHRVELPRMVESDLGSRGVAVGAVVRAHAAASESVYANSAVEAPRIATGGSSVNLRDALAALAERMPSAGAPTEPHENVRQTGTPVSSATVPA